MVETATEVREQAQDKAQEAASKATDKVRTQVDQRSTEAGERVASTASDMRSVGDHLREQGKDQPAKLADQAADRVERAGTWLRESDADRILQDVEDFGRRQPWALGLGGLALGIFAARFLKASSSQRYQQRRPFTSASNGSGSPSGQSGASAYPAMHRREATAVDVTPQTPPPPATTPTPPGRIAKEGL